MPRPREARAEELGGISETLAAAFLPDPILGWIYPDADERPEIYPRFFRAIADAYFEQGWVITVDGLCAGAICLPPGARPAQAQLARLEAISGKHARRLATAAAVTRQAHPKEPHYFLAFIGSHPDRRGSRLGSTLLRHLLARCDRLHLPAYLEATSPANRELYAAHGFVAITEAKLPSGPPLWPMWREPSQGGPLATSVRRR